jgi:hypothetical protein
MSGCCGIRDHEVDDARRAAGEDRRRPGEEIIGRDRSHERELHVRMRIDAARDHVLAARIELFRRSPAPSPRRRRRPPRCGPSDAQHVGLELAVGVDDGAAAYQEGCRSFRWLRFRHLHPATHAQAVDQRRDGEADEPGIRIDALEEIADAREGLRERGMEESRDVGQDPEHERRDRDPVPARAVGVFAVLVVERVDIQLLLADEVVVDDEDPGDRARGAPNSR